MNQLLTQLPKKHKILLAVAVAFILIMLITPTKQANNQHQPMQSVAIPVITDTTNTSNTSIAAQTQPSTSAQNIKTADISNQIPNSNKSQNASQNENHDPSQGLEIGKLYPLEMDLSALKPQQQAPQPALNLQNIEVKHGDNLALIFKRAGFSAQTLFAITSLGKSTQMLKKIHPGDTLTFASSQNDNGKKQLEQLQYHFNPTSTLQVKRSQDKNDKNTFTATTTTKEVELREQFASATIRSNFWNAGIDAGLSENQIMNLANIFGWDIDFAMDLRDGDEFTVIYENQFVDGEFVDTGNIIAAEFINQGEVYQAVRYKDGEYYSPEGRSMRKAFLRAPVNFKYVSSNFKPRRFHPVLKRWKAHRGVDYAAKTGTPVVAAGSGKIIRSAYNKYNGHHVFIQHPGGIVTKYLHFSKRKVKHGQKIKQGQVIGLVGSTGLSSAPHLHYEFIVNGVHRNPRTVKLPKAKPIAKSEKQQFLALAQAKMANMHSSKRVMLAFKDHSKTGYSE